jgi:hypothetical protein
MNSAAAIIADRPRSIALENVLHIFYFYWSGFEGNINVKVSEAIVQFMKSISDSEESARSKSRLFAHNNIVLAQRPCDRC